MKKVLIMSYDLNVGGIEKSLLSLIKNMLKNDLEVTLVLQEKRGELLHVLPSQVNIIEYKVSDSKPVIFRKIKNRLKLLRFIHNYKNAYDCVISYTPYILPFAYIAPRLSKNSVIFVHNDYYDYYKGNVKEMKAFFNERKIQHFKTIVFVANEAKNHFHQYLPEYTNNLIVCNNLLDYVTIDQGLNSHAIEKNELITFINISRHDQHQKQLDRLIEATRILRDKGYSFKVQMIGAGPDTDYYKKLVHDHGLEMFIDFLGLKQNPYPYLNQADAFVLTSDYEGFPVVYLESLYLKVPLITTINVSDSSIHLTELNSIIVDKTASSIAEGMELVLKGETAFDIQFDVEYYNNEVLKQLLDIV